MQEDSMELQEYGYDFAKIALGFLNEISEPAISKECFAICLDELQELILTYLDYLPRHFVELLDFLEQLISKNTFRDLLTIQGHAFLVRTQLLCKLMCEPPSLELYINLALHEFECLYQYTDFSEETISSVIDYLLHIENGTPLSDDVVAIFNKFNMSNEKIRLLWISLSKVPTTKALQIKAIENVKLTGEYFLEFCREFSISANGDEKVLSALVKRVSTETISKASKRNNEFKATIFYYITLCAVPPISVVKEIVEVINPNNDNYFNFFYMIIHDFAKTAELSERKLLLGTILKKINSDESSKTEEVKIQIRRLRLLATNL